MSDMNDEHARRAARAVRNALSDQTIDVDAGLKQVRRAPDHVRRSLVATGLSVVLVAGTIGLAMKNGGGETPTPSQENPFALASSLTPFDQCDELSDYFKENLKKYYAQGYGPMPVQSFAQDTRTATAEIAPQVPQANDSAGTQAAKVAGQDYSTTNVQEAGVDEPDVVKTDGKRIATVTAGRVNLLEVSNRKPVLKHTFDITLRADKLFMNGDRLLVFKSPQTKTDSNRFEAGTTITSGLVIYDISDLTKPRFISEVQVDGTVMDARMADGQVRIVTSSAPRIHVPVTYYGNDEASKNKFEETLNKSIDSAQFDDWIPQYSVKDERGNETAKGRLVECDHLAKPETFSGIETLSVSSLDINQNDLTPNNTVGVIAGASGQHIYATARTLYVAITDYMWGDRDKGQVGITKTHLHKFETKKSGETLYRASGDVDGTLLNQYAMSEYKDALRVATTVTSQAGLFTGAASQGVVTSFQESDNKLVKKGSLSGLGVQDNESVRAVRFIDDKGYVVTFRQTDPLYVIDLSDAANPRKLGELKIPGYSGYLHPISDTLLLGVGQSGGGGNASGATIDMADPKLGLIAPSPPESRWTAPQIQFSLFDISDAGHPKRIAEKTFASGSASAEYDAKAFLYWQKRNLVVAPITTYSPEYSGVVLVNVANSKLDEVGRIEDKRAGERSGVQITRSFVIDNDLFTLSDRSIQTTDLDNLSKTTRLDF